MSEASNTPSVLDVDGQITALSDEWYSLVGRDHHKDRDCHFFIEKKWSYGQPPVYVVQHYGYVADEVEEEFNTSADAHIFLVRLLQDMIETERKHGL